MSTPHGTVLIVGAGPVGLCNARTLLQDGFDVTIVTRVRSIALFVDFCLEWPACQLALDALTSGCEGRGTMDAHVPGPRDEFPLGLVHLLVRAGRSGLRAR